MTHNECYKCKCNTCGSMHNCEIIMDKIIGNSAHSCSSKCEIILSCNNYNSKKDFNAYKEWVCEVKKN